jgi:hypothetical protein
MLTAAEILSVVLSLYMYGEGANLQLPGSDEVLVCTSTTTAENVFIHLFLLRVTRDR